MASWQAAVDLAVNSSDGESLEEGQVTPYSIDANDVVHVHDSDSAAESAGSAGTGAGAAAGAGAGAGDKHASSVASDRDGSKKRSAPVVVVHTSAAAKSHVVYNSDGQSRSVLPVANKVCLSFSISISFSSSSSFSLSPLL